MDYQTLMKIMIDEVIMPRTKDFWEMEKKWEHWLAMSTMESGITASIKNLWEEAVIWELKISMKISTRKTTTMSNEKITKVENGIWKFGATLRTLANEETM